MVSAPADGKGARGLRPQQALERVDRPVAEERLSVVHAHVDAGVVRDLGHLDVLRQRHGADHHLLLLLQRGGGHCVQALVLRLQVGRVRLHVDVTAVHTRLRNGCYRVFSVTAARLV
eukprot:248133-Prorocentrum_minimum.AAC.1